MIFRLYVGCYAGLPKGILLFHIPSPCFSFNKYPRSLSRLRILRMSIDAAKSPKSDED